MARGNSRHSVRYRAQITKRTGKQMIDEYYTFLIFGYRVDELSKWKKVPIVAMCDECCEYRTVRYDSYTDYCRSCTQKMYKHAPRSKEAIRKTAEANTGRKHTDEARANMSIGQRNKKPVTEETRKRMSESHIGSTRSEETRKKMSVSRKNLPPYSQEWRDNISKSKKGIKMSDEACANMSIAQKKRDPPPPKTLEQCQRISAGKQGIPFDEWTEFVRDGEYCHKFNEEIKEYIRNKYNRLCYVCDKNENTNGRKLDVHHTDLNKNQGCDEHDWRLVPLCRSCHSSAHAEPLKSRIEYLRADEEPDSV